MTSMPPAASIRSWPREVGLADAFLAACVQTRADIDPGASLSAVLPLVREAAAAGATYIQTPEMTNILQPDRPKFFAAIHAEADDPSLAAYRAEAARLRVWLHVGSLALKGPGVKAVNRGFLIRPDGAIAARYDKIHMFDVDLGNGQSYRESAAYEPGATAVVAPLPWIGLGMTICYDLRFPALARALAEAGAGVIAIPSSFTVPTGRAHWHVLMRARAIETGCYVVAAAQGGRHACGRETFGHSLIVDPWGEIVAEADHAEPCVILATIDPAKVAEIRGKIPSLGNARAFSLEGAR